MRDEELVQENNPLDSTSSAHLTPYEMLVRQSKKLGRGATSASRTVREKLNHEISLLSGRKPDDTPTQMTAEKQKELEDVARLKKAVKKSHQVLANVRTVFPLTLFPNTVIVDRTKVTIITRDFFLVSDDISFQVSDILNVSCTVGPMFGSITIASRVMSTVDHFKVNYLWRQDAVFLKNLIQGHIIAKNNQLETSHLSLRETIDTLLELGTDSDR